MKALILTVLVLGAVMWIWRPSLRRDPIPAPCTGCGTTLARRSAFGLCAVCLDRHERTEQAASAQRAAWHESERNAWRAEQESTRRAQRFPLLTVGSVYLNEHGEPVFDGFAFHGPADPDGKLPAAVAHAGRHPRSALICGWKPAELHALAHGEACTCLER